jgi:hypothetical protein
MLSRRRSHVRLELRLAFLCHRHHRFSRRGIIQPGVHLWMLSMCDSCSWRVLGSVAGRSWGIGVTVT